MLRTNLATRPFYNERAVQLVLGLVLVLVVAITAFNIGELIRLNASQRTLGAHAAESEREAARLRREAARIRAQINAKELESVANAAREANGIIDQRAFSWSELFDQLEQTLPDDVRITAVDPTLTKEGEFIIQIAVEARRSEDVDQFIEALEKTGSFRDLITPTEATDDDGLLKAVIRGSYIRPEEPRG
ncbi:MAG TPA: PilN domain-containing protein [Vicinamibacterales bacterium]|jgi:type IV pilus assembly protein PilN|nr:PilN domain-containing protein [Vicinamibacterales bacterium]